MGCARIWEEGGEIDGMVGESVCMCVLPRGAKRASSSAFQYFLICKSLIFVACASREEVEVAAAEVRFFLRGAGERIGEEGCSGCGMTSGVGMGSGMETSSITSVWAGSGTLDVGFLVEVESVVLGLVTRADLLLKERVDCAARIAPALLRRVGGMMGRGGCCGPMRLVCIWRDALRSWY